MKQSFAKRLALFTFALLPCLGQPIDSYAAPPACLDEKMSTTLADDYGHLISNWTSNSTASQNLANQIMSPDYQDFTESIATLVSKGCSIGPQPWYSSREAWAKGQLTVPPLPYERLMLWHNCDSIFVRWRSPQKPFNVTGLYVLQTTAPPKGMSTTYSRVIAQSWSEFNSAPWLINAGWKGGNCTTT